MTAVSEKRSRVRHKHVPQRTCVACREMKPKKELVRIVSTESGVTVDQSGKLPGRGCYLCKSKGCWDNALKKEHLDHALRTKIATEDKIALSQYKGNFTS